MSSYRSKYAMHYIRYCDLVDVAFVSQNAYDSSIKSPVRSYTHMTDASHKRLLAWMDDHKDNRAKVGLKGIRLIYYREISPIVEEIDFAETIKLYIASMRYMSDDEEIVFRSRYGFDPTPDGFGWKFVELTKLADKKD